MQPDEWEAFQQAVVSEVKSRHIRFLQGVCAYRRHPQKKHVLNYPVIWQQGTTRLLDCRIKDHDSPAVLIIPSLINRSYILDISRRNSLVRGLSRRGVSPFLLDWDWPGEQEKSFDLTDYVVRRIEPALHHLHQTSGRPVALLGYCMGGLLALAQAIRSPKLVSGLVVMAAPWDFHEGTEISRALLKVLWERIQEVLISQGEMPVDVLQAMFAVMDPDLTIRKFSTFCDHPRKSGFIKQFVGLEDWVNDGVPLVRKVATECLEHWYLNNTPAHGKWLIDGQAVQPGEVRCPSLVIIPDRDKIVPPAGAFALAQDLPNSSALYVSGGHVGMLLSRYVGRQIFAPIAHKIKKWAF